MQKKWNAKRVSEKISKALGLYEDLIVDEVASAENQDEAIRRIKRVRRDAAIALRILMAVQ